MESPIHCFQAALKRRKVDAFLVTQPENRRYLSGFTATDMNISESSGSLLILSGDPPFLLTDFRYQQQALADTKGFEICIYKKGLLDLLKTELPRLGIKRLAFEGHYLLFQTARKLQELADMLAIELIPITGLIEKQRTCKDPGELALIRRAVRLNEEVFIEVFKSLRPGMTERQVAIRIETLMRERGASGPSFETIVAAGPNGALPHAVPGDRPLVEGEPIVIDMGLVLDGYCSDMTRTVVLGRIAQKTRKLFRLVRKAQLAGIKAIRPGRTGLEVDMAARRIITEAGYGEAFGHGLGHGVGLAVHEAPSLSFRNRKQLKPGMVVTVEPGIYLPGWGGIRLENMVVVTPEGCELLNSDTTFLDI
ncbi:MAG: Xaa-Pro peptidase family protein [Proteobacteria bacterium]|nr:Xaa-Pro peptidase family protein [Pseudomonadota bacterium]MBU1687530.1 Xaa-Pro peptidase family protein [Pseudomonadota bacterium]